MSGHRSLENSPYNQPLDHSRRDLTLKRAATIARARRERFIREATEIRQQRAKDDREARYREEREAKQKEERDARHKDEREARHKDEREAKQKEVENKLNAKNIGRHHGLDGRRVGSVIVPTSIRPPPELKPIYRGHVTVDTTKAKSNIDVLRLCIHALGWREVISPRREPCDFYWNAFSFSERSEIMSGRINKFPGAQELLNKVNLFRTLDFMRNLFPAEYDFYPRSWFLPFQFHDFSNEVRQHQEKKVRPKPTYIVKPNEGSQGEGIYLIRDAQQYNSYSGRCHIIQEYLCDVLLLDRYKFDLRVYVSVTNVDPLEFHICKEGLARFSTIPYENPTNKNLQEVYMHLTNYSLNKRSSTFNASDKDEEGSKRKLTAVFQQMERMGYDTVFLWERIELIVCKTLLAIVGELRISYQNLTSQHGKRGPKCFQIYGFDIIVMKNLKPMLLEVNANPSLSILAEQEVSPGVFESIHSAKDQEVKFPLVRDTLVLMAPRNKYTRKRRHQNEVENKPPDKVTNIVIKIMEMRVKETAIRILDPSMEVDEDKKDDSGDDSDDKMQEESGTDSENKMDDDDEDDDDSNEDDENDDKDEKAAQKKKEEEEEEEEAALSCLKKIFPDVYGQKLEYLRLMERFATLFTKCLGVRGAQRIGPTAFRMFSRKCRLNHRGVTSAALDILYIDMQRKWEYTNPERSSGLGFQGFVDACFEISRRKFYVNNRREMIEAMMNYCEDALDDVQRQEEAFKLRLARPPRKLPRRAVNQYQRSTVASLEAESVPSVYDSPAAPRRIPMYSNSYDVHRFISAKKKDNYKPKPLRLYSSDDD